MKVLVADLLCGAGGSSTGCAQALAAMDLEMELVCVNHWPIAIETHTKNHPKARHYCQDIATVRPGLVVPEGYLDLLMASPSCTHHSVARGGKPTSDQQRSDPWHIITWLTELDVHRLIIENVWEFIKWGPVDPATGKPIKERQGEYFQMWIELIRKLDYELEWRKQNAADFGGATTRSRFIMMGKKRRSPIPWPAPTRGKLTGKPWKPAREIIDWSLRGKSIFTRKKPLSRKTLMRIEAGARKFNWPEPFLVVLRNHMDGRSVESPLPALTAGGTHIGLAQPIILGVGQGAPRDGGQPLPTITTGGAGTAVRPGCARPMLIEPFILSRYGEGYGADRAHSIEHPTPTASCRGAGYLIEPFVLSQASGGAPRATDEPLPTSPHELRRDCRADCGLHRRRAVLARHRIDAAVFDHRLSPPGAAMKGTPWTERETARLYRLRERGLGWDAISVAIPSRSPSGCEQRFNKGRTRRAELHVEVAPAPDPAPRVMPPPSARAMSSALLVTDAELRGRIAVQGLTAGLLGDPPPGRSALDQKRLAGLTAVPGGGSAANASEGAS